MSKLIKDDGDTVAFRKGGGPNEIYFKSGAMVAGNYITSECPVMVPSIILPGTDLKVWMDLGAMNFAALPANGMAPSGAIEVGGFHFAPGSNGSNAQAGGSTIPQINPLSMWDLNFRPKCLDRRAMTLVGDSFWSDMYLLGRNHHINGTSAYGVEIATGTAKPVRPWMFGGNGTALAELNYWTAVEIMRSHGKSLLSYDEFICAAFGVLENASRGSSPLTTGLSTTNTGTEHPDEAFTSASGLFQATGVHWIILRELGYSLDDGNYDGISRAAMVNPGFWSKTEGRGVICGETPRSTRMSLAGGKFNLNTVSTGSGSRAFDWADAVQDVSLSISARGRADHHCVN